MKYFLDHPQIKRKKALGNGSTPTKKAPTSRTREALDTSKGSDDALRKFAQHQIKSGVKQNTDPALSKPNKYEKLGDDMYENVHEPLKKKK